MTDEVSIDDLVTSTSPPTGTPAPPEVATDKTHDVNDPAAKIDPAAALDPAKATPKAKRRRKRSPRPTKKATATREAAATARSVSQMAEGRRRKANAASASASAEEASAAYAAAKANRVASFDELPKGAGLRLRFADGSAFVDDGVEVLPGALDNQGARKIYAGTIDFAPEASSAFVTEAWLIADSGQAICCDVGIGLATGGGSHAVIPPGHLIF
jgi:hypothetical protein